MDRAPNSSSLNELALNSSLNNSARTSEHSEHSAHALGVRHGASVNSMDAPDNAPSTPFPRPLDDRRKVFSQLRHRAPQSLLPARTVSVEDGRSSRSRPLHTGALPRPTYGVPNQAQISSSMAPLSLSAARLASSQAGKEKRPGTGTDAHAASVASNSAPIEVDPDDPDGVFGAPIEHASQSVELADIHTDSPPMASSSRAPVPLLSSLAFGGGSATQFLGSRSPPGRAPHAASVASNSASIEVAPDDADGMFGVSMFADSHADSPPMASSSRAPAPLLSSLAFGGDSATQFLGTRSPPGRAPHAASVASNSVPIEVAPDDANGVFGVSMFVDSHADSPPMASSSRAPVPLLSSRTFGGDSATQFLGTRSPPGRAPSSLWSPLTSSAFDDWKWSSSVSSSSPWPSPSTLLSTTQPVSYHAQPRSPLVWSPFAGSVSFSHVPESQLSHFVLGGETCRNLTSGDHAACGNQDEAMPFHVGRGAESAEPRTNCNSPQSEKPFENVETKSSSAEASDESEAGRNASSATSAEGSRRTTVMSPSGGEEDASSASTSVSGASVATLSDICATASENGHGTPRRNSLAESPLSNGSLPPVIHAGASQVHQHVELSAADSVVGSGNTEIEAPHRPSSQRFAEEKYDEESVAHPCCSPTCCPWHAEGRPEEDFNRTHLTSDEVEQNNELLSVLRSRKFALASGEMVCPDYDAETRSCPRSLDGRRCPWIHNENPNWDPAKRKHCRNWIASRGSKCSNCDRLHNCNPFVRSGVFNSNPKRHHPA